MHNMLSADELRRQIATRGDWFHTIDFGQGVRSPGTCPWDYERDFLSFVALPERLDGKRVLDIGTYDGFFAFECESRGAEVVAVDVHPVDLRCFKLARDLLGSRVKYHHVGVYELDVDQLGGPFDLVLFFGVFYHLRHIILSLDNIWGVLKDWGELRMETHVCDNHFILKDGTITTLKEIDPRLCSTPLFRFYRTNELNKDDWSNWFGGNSAAILDCLGSAGFTDAKLLHTWSSRGAFSARKNPRRPREWEIGSYEGTKFKYNDDGTWTVVWHDPKKGR
jgi:tRNA (mo5U34)-methyltransferase